MQNLQKISRCLISVSDKTKIVEIAQFLQNQNIEIISTGGTKKLLQDNKINAKDISEFTNFPEIMDGRVKTLHPKVHGGLLAIPTSETHQKQAKENDIHSIDLLIVNLYPFVETLAKTDDEDEIIENIDIGGPAMVRSAAKNFAFKAVVTSPLQYEELQAQIVENKGQTSFEFRKKLAAEAFQNIAEYDIAIADFFNKSSSKLTINANLKQTLRYGENSHQKAAIYSNSNSGIVNATQIQGKELSYNNFNDSDAAYGLALEFNQPTCAIIKHANPCGVAVGQNPIEAFKKALSSDPKSAFGGIVAINDEIDENLAQEIAKIFFEVIIAKSITEKAKEVFAAKKNLRILIADFKKTDEKQIKSISGGFLLQEKDQKTIIASDLKKVSEASVNKEEIDQLVFAMNICKHVKSNAITIVNNFQTVGIGMGQTSRVDACQSACEKAKNFNLNGEVIDKAKGAFLASDAFFPFADNIEIAAKYGIKAIIATGGSVRDQEVIDAANANKIALYFIETRHFRH
jgi:phosphoribosylaminoimidazolecarboxamide formyltransferase/IMP cyclohydrolase